jgi:hypothetical protein
MNPRCRFLVGLFLVALATTPASAGLIDFDDGTAGVPVGPHYSALGANFGNARWDGFVSFGESGVGAGGLKITDEAGTYMPKADNPIVITFSDPLLSVSIRGLNVGVNGARLNAYDSVVGGNLLGFSEALGVGYGVENHPLLSLSAAGIRRIELFQPNSQLLEGLLFDNLFYAPMGDPVGGGGQPTDVPPPDVSRLPEPSALLLAGLGVAGSALALRRRRRA